MEKKSYGKTIDEALGLWIKLARSFSVFNKRVISQIRSFGLTQAQFSVLECLNHLGPLTIGELCTKMLVSGGNMTVVIDNLEKQELVERVPSKEDRRAIQVKLTEKGEKLIEQIFPQHARYIAQMASVLTPQEQEHLSRLLKKLGFSLQK
jgi:MarR family 2-MHQ and catechol resistance regulon transcriptional repressor